MKSMNIKKNRKMTRRTQTTLEYIIIVAVVAIAAIIAAVVYMKSTSGSSVGSSTQILAVGVNGNNQVIALSKALPSGVSVDLNGNTMGTDSALTYVDNYPEYSFTPGANAIGAGTVITSLTYNSGSGTISVLPATNVTVQTVTANVVQP